jgi:branched-chain amino acid transport system permease protein
MTESALDSGKLLDASRWHPVEYAFWILPIAAYFVFPDNLALLAQIAIAAVFAISLDLILGYAGIVSLGHAAFFGIGAYAAGLLAQAGWGDPILGLACATLTAAATGWGWRRCCMFQPTN